MTSYTEIANGQIDQDSAITQPLMTALRDNPGAIAEGATNAPVVQYAWHPYDMVLVGDGNDGLFYDHSVDGTVAIIETPTLADGYEYRVILDGLEHNSGAPTTLSGFLYKATTGAYAAGFTISATCGVTEEVSGYLDMARCRTDATAHFMAGATVATGAGVFAVTAGSEMGTAQKIGKAKLSFGAGSISAGRAYLHRRRAL